MQWTRKYTLGGVFVPLTFAIMLWLYWQDANSSGVLLEIGSTQEDRLDVQASIQTIDPIKGEMSVRLDFSGHGQGLVNGDGALLKEINIITNSALKHEIQFKKGQRLSAVDIVIGLYDGQYSRYPFDRHRADLELSAWTNESSENAGVLPLQLELSGAVPGLKVQAKADPEVAATFKSDPRRLADAGFVSVQLGVERSATTTFWALFVMLLLWAMALAVVAVTSAFAMGKRKLEFGAFTWMGSMLFAFVGFRSAAPGVPPIGALIDVLAFFWAELIVALCLVMTVVVYLRRSP